MELPRDVARYQAALPRTRRGVTRHGVNQHSHARRKPVIPTLSQNSGDRAGKYIARPSTCHSRVAALAQGWGPSQAANECAGPLEHHRATVSCRTSESNADSRFACICSVLTSRSRPASPGCGVSIQLSRGGGCASAMRFKASASTTSGLSLANTACSASRAHWVRPAGRGR